MKDFDLNLDEEVTLTLLPVDKDGKLIPKKEITAKHREEIAEFLSKLEDKINKLYITFYDEEERLEKLDQSRTMKRWQTHHPDALIFSNMKPDFIYKVTVKHKATEKQFMAYYYEGKSQICNTLTEKFNPTKLI